MAFVRAPLAEVRELGLAPDGEYTLRVNSFKLAKTKTCYFGTLGFVEEKYAPIQFFVYLPKEDDEPEKVENKWRSMKRFLTAFEVDMEEEGFDDAEVAGKIAENLRVILATEEDQETGEEVEVNKVIWPKFEEVASPEEDGE